MPELLDSMDVGRASFYNAFGSKRDVFLRILNLYFGTVDTHLAGLIANAPDSESAVASLVDGILDVARSAEPNATGWRGCLIGNTALELGADDQEIVDQLRIGVDVLRTQFKKALSLPSAGGVKRSNVEIERSALHLVASVQGCLFWPNPGYRMPTSKARGRRCLRQ
ncbi:TetR/AcrR family transcriptional regulator [Bradyrhizobium genosp. P]|uniref:TetR/AcrR family transcriptional regulator n=1 Tax=Bradyrhizobium genosp. P TaxID=83641 RepID=UPI003CFB7C6A